jgi:hypothetical protein
MAVQRCRKKKEPFEANKSVRADSILNLYTQEQLFGFSAVPLQLISSLTSAFCVTDPSFPELFPLYCFAFKGR